MDFSKSFSGTYLRNLWLHVVGLIGVMIWLLILCSGMLSLVLTCCIFFCSEYWLLGIAYLTWMYYDRNTPSSGGRRWKCKWKLPFPKWYALYFPLKLVKTAELDPNRNYLMACHPHGICVAGVTGNLASDGNNAHQLFPGLKTNFVTLSFLFFIPVYREILLAIGGCSVSAESISALLQRREGGNIVLIIPGGAREVLYSRPGVDEIYLKNRKGFVRAAIQNGAPLVPVYSFGENEVFTQVSNPKGSRLRAFQEKTINWIGAPLLLFWGRGIFQNYFGLLPRRHPITTVVGAPIEVTQMYCPTEEYVHNVHAKYTESLIELYNVHRHIYGNPASELLIN